jgi:diguanylate cyclase (GGDEF)-like protein
MPDAKDDLTDLANRSLFEEEVQFAIDAGAGPRLGLVLIRLENFSGTAGGSGPETTDPVLATVAEGLRRTVRPRDMVARLGGVDFAVLLEDVGTAAIDAIAKRITRTVNESMAIGENLVRVQASVGVARGGPAVDAAALIRQAGAAVTQASSSAARYAWFSGPEPN